MHWNSHSFAGRRTRKHLRVVMDVVKRYDIDVQLDDYEPGADYCDFNDEKELAKIRLPA